MTRETRVRLTPSPTIRAKTQVEPVVQVDCVYLIGERGGSLVKIGHSGDPARRLAAIRMMSPVPLDLLWSHPGGVEVEAALHLYFAEIRRHGEWFDFGSVDPVQAVSRAVADRSWLSERRWIPPWTRGASSCKGKDLGDSYAGYFWCREPGRLVCMSPPCPGSARSEVIIDRD